MLCLALPYPSIHLSPKRLLLGGPQPGEFGDAASHGLLGGDGQGGRNALLTIDKRAIIDHLLVQRKGRGANGLDLEFSLLGHAPFAGELGLVCELVVAGIERDVLESVCGVL